MTGKVKPNFYSFEEEPETSRSPQEHSGVIYVKDQKSPDFTFRKCASISCVIFKLSIHWMRTWRLETENLRLQMFSGSEPTLGVSGVRVRVGVKVLELVE